MSNLPPKDPLEERFKKLEKRIEELEAQIGNSIGNIGKRLGTITIAIVMGLIGGGIVNWFLTKGSEIEQKVTKLETELGTIKNQLDKLDKRVERLEVPPKNGNGLSPIIFKNGSLTKGYGMSVSSSFNRNDWLVDGKNNDSKCMSYPGGNSNQDWGAVSITVGAASDIKRGADFSQYNNLFIEIIREEGSKPIYIGLRDEQLPDYETGDRYEIDNISQEWATKSIEISEENFPNTNFRNLYTVASFVFLGQQKQTVCFRTIKYE